MAENSNLIAVQTFVEIHMLMGNLHYPRIKFYWSLKLQVPQISVSMPINRFYSLRTHLHFVDTQRINVGETD